MHPAGSGASARARQALTSQRRLALVASASSHVRLLHPREYLLVFKASSIQRFLKPLTNRLWQPVDGNGHAALHEANMATIVRVSELYA